MSAWRIVPLPDASTPRRRLRSATLANLAAVLARAMAEDSH